MQLEVKFCQWQPLISHIPCRKISHDETTFGIGKNQSQSQYLGEEKKIEVTVCCIILDSHRQ
jgi:hypothetical protein